jgi:RNA polymerase sigma factor, sigma-70 family
MEQSFEDVLEQYTPMIHHIIKSLNIYKDKDRYVQEAAISLWEACKSFDASKGSFTSYAYSSIRGKLLNYLKKENKWETQHLFVDQPPEQPIDGVIPVLESIEEYTQYLSNNQKIWVVEYICNDKKIEEIASQEGVSISAVKSWRKEALKKLKKQFVH